MQSSVSMLHAYAYIYTAEEQENMVQVSALWKVVFWRFKAEKNANTFFAYSRMSWYLKKLDMTGN